MIILIDPIQVSIQLWRGFTHSYGLLEWLRRYVFTIWNLTRRSVLLKSWLRLAPLWRTHFLRYWYRCRRRRWFLTNSWSSASYIRLWRCLLRSWHPRARSLSWCSHSTVSPLHESLGIFFPLLLSLSLLLHLSLVWCQDCWLLNVTSGACRGWFFIQLGQTGVDKWAGRRLLCGLGWRSRRRLIAANCEHFIYLLKLWFEFLL